MEINIPYIEKRRVYVCASLSLAMESHGECEIKVKLNCSDCQSQRCKRDEESQLILCLCDNNEVLASDNITCVSEAGT